VLEKTYLMWYSCQAKSKRWPNSFPNMGKCSSLLSLSETDIFEKSVALWMEKLVANLLQTSTEWFQKWQLLRTSSSSFENRLCSFPTLFLIQYAISMHDWRTELQWAVNWWRRAKSSYFGFSEFYQQFCGQVSWNWTLLLSQKTGTAMCIHPISLITSINCFFITL